MLDPTIVAIMKVAKMNPWGMLSPLGLSAGVHRNTKVYMDPSKRLCMAPRSATRRSCGKGAGRKIGGEGGGTKRSGKKKGEECGGEGFATRESGGEGRGGHRATHTPRQRLAFEMTSYAVRNWSRMEDRVADVDVPLASASDACATRKK